MTNAGELWESACGILKQEMTDISYQTWIESSLKPFGLIGDTLILECINAMMREYGINRIMPQIQNAVSTAAGKALTVEALCQEEMDSRVRELEAKYTGNTLAQLNPKYTFDTFVVGSGNRFAHAVSLAVPLCSAAGEAVYAMSVSAPSFRMEETELRRCVEMLTSVRQKLEPYLQTV